MKRLSGFFSLPNILSLSRIPYGMVIWFLISKGISPWVIFPTGAIGALTDLFDGRIARKRGIATRTGEILDPICDKIYIAECAFGLLHRMPPRLMWAWLGVQALFATASLVAIWKKKVDAKAPFSGKVRVWVEFFSITMFLFHQPTIGAWLLGTALILSPITAWQAVKKNRAHLKK